MAKNVEINVNINGTTYETLYPKASYGNMNGSLDINNTSGVLNKSKGGTGTNNTSGGRVFYYISWTGNGGSLTLTIPDFGLTPIGILIHGAQTEDNDVKVIVDSLLPIPCISGTYPLGLKMSNGYYTKTNPNAVIQVLNNNTQLKFGGSLEDWVNRVPTGSINSNYWAIVFFQ